MQATDAWWDLACCVIPSMRFITHAGLGGGGTHNFHSQVIRIVYELELIIAPKRGGRGSASRPLPLVIQREYVHSYNMIQQSV